MSRSDRTDQRGFQSSRPSPALRYRKYARGRFGSSRGLSSSNLVGEIDDSLKIDLHVDFLPESGFDAVLILEIIALGSFKIKRDIGGYEGDCI